MWGAIITVVKLCVGGWSSRSGELGVRAVCLIQQIYQEGVLWASSLWSTTRVTENSRPSAEKLAPYWCILYLVNFRWGCEMSVRKVWGDVISKPMNSHLFILQIYIGWYLRYQALGIQDLCIQDRLYFPSPGKRWKTKTKGGEERGKLSGDGWRHKIITKAEGGAVGRDCATLCLRSWAKHILLVSRGFPDGRSISIRGLPATEWFSYSIVFCFFSPTFYNEVMGKFSKTEKLKEWELSYIHLLESTVNISLC